MENFHAVLPMPFDRYFGRLPYPRFILSKKALSQPRPRLVPVVRIVKRHTHDLLRPISVTDRCWNFQAAQLRRRPKVYQSEPSQMVLPKPPLNAADHHRPLNFHPSICNTKTKRAAHNRLPIFLLLGKTKLHTRRGTPMGLSSVHRDSQGVRLELRKLLKSTREVWHPPAISTSLLLTVTSAKELLSINDEIAS